MKKIIVLFIWFLICNTALSQQTYQSSTFNADINAGYTIIGTVNKNLLIFMNTSDGYKLYTFNDKMEVIQYETLPYIILPLISIHFFTTQIGMQIFYQCTDKNYRKLYAVQYNTSAKIIANPILLDSNEVKNTSEFDIQSSDNKKYFLYSYSTNNNNSINIKSTVLSDSLHKINSTTNEVESRNYQILNFISNKGNECTLLKTINSNNQLEEVSIVNNNEKLKLANKGEIFNYCLQHINNNTNELNVFLKNNAILKRQRIDLASHQIISSTNVDVNEIINQSSSIPTNVVLNNANGFTLLLEDFSFIHKIYSEHLNNRIVFSGIPMESTTTKDEYTYGDITALNIDSNNHIVWKKIIVKNQITEDDEGKYSGFSLLKSKNNLWMLYNEMNNTNSIQIIKLNTNGKTTCETENIVQNIDGYLLCTNAKQLSFNIVIVPCVLHNALSFVKIKI